MSSFLTSLPHLLVKAKGGSKTVSIILIRKCWPVLQPGAQSIYIGSKNGPIRLYSYPSKST